MQASYKQIWKIAYPIIFGSIAQTLISVTDTAFMGRVSQTAQAAIGIVSVYYLILFMIGYSYTKGTQILVARRVGEGKPQLAGEIFDNSMLVILGLSLALFVFLKFFSESSLGLIISGDEVHAASYEYMDMRSYGLFFGFAGSVFLAFYMGIGKMGILLVSIITMSVSNIFLNYVLIFGKFGFPEMGIAGAALASNIAEALAALIFIGYTLTKRINHKYQLFKIKTYSLSVIQKLTSLSLPIVLQTVIGLTAWMMFFGFVEKMGEHELAISSVVKSIYIVFGIPAWGFSSAANTVISNLMGQGQLKQVIQGIKKIVIMSLGVTVTLTLALAIFPEFFLRVYTDDPGIIHDSIPVILVCIAALWVYSASTILYHAIVSIGSTKVSLIIEVLVIFLYLVFLKIIFNWEGATLPIVWTSEIFYWLAIATCSFGFLLSGKWKRVRI